MEFLVEFELAIPEGVTEVEVEDRELLAAFSLAAWMDASVTPLVAHPNDPVRSA